MFNERNAGARIANIALFAGKLLALEALNGFIYFTMLSGLRIIGNFPVSHEQLLKKIIELGAQPAYHKAAIVERLSPFSGLPKMILTRLQNAINLSRAPIDEVFFEQMLDVVLRSINKIVQLQPHAITNPETALARSASILFTRDPADLNRVANLKLILAALGGLQIVLTSLALKSLVADSVFLPQVTQRAGNFLHWALGGQLAPRRTFAYFGPRLNIRNLDQLERSLARTRETLLEALCLHLAAVTGCSEEQFDSLISLETALFPLAQTGQLLDISYPGCREYFTNPELSPEGSRSFGQQPFTVPFSLLQLIFTYVAQAGDVETAAAMRGVLKNPGISTQKWSLLVLPPAAIVLLAYLLQKIANITYGTTYTPISLAGFGQCLMDNQRPSEDLIPWSLIDNIRRDIEQARISRAYGDYYQLAKDLRRLYDSRQFVVDKEGPYVCQRANWHNGELQYVQHYYIEGGLGSNRINPLLRCRKLKQYQPATVATETFQRCATLTFNDESRRIQIGITEAAELAFLTIAFLLMAMRLFYIGRAYINRRLAPAENRFHYLSSPTLNTNEQQAAREVVTQFKSLALQRKQQLRDRLTVLLGEGELFVGGAGRVLDTLFTGLASLGAAEPFDPKVVFVNGRSDASYIVVTEAQESELLQNLRQRYRGQGICIKSDRDMQSLVIQQVRAVFQRHAAVPFLRTQQAAREVSAAAIER